MTWHRPMPNPYTNPSPRKVRHLQVRRRRGPLRRKQYRPAATASRSGQTHFRREFIDWLGTLTLSGGDLDGQKFTCWPWEKRFIMGTFSQPGNAALSIARGNGKSGFVAALATAVVCPGAPLHGSSVRSSVCASSFGQARIIYEDVLSYADRAWAMTWPTVSLWRTSG